MGPVRLQGDKKLRADYSVDDSSIDKLRRYRRSLTG